MSKRSGIILLNVSLTSNIDMLLDLVLDFIDQLTRLFQGSLISSDKTKP